MEIVGVGLIVIVLVAVIAVVEYNAVKVTVYVPGVPYVIVCVGEEPTWPLPNLQIKPSGLPVQFWVNVTACGLQNRLLEVEKVKSTV